MADSHALILALAQTGAGRLRRQSADKFLKNKYRDGVNIDFIVNTNHSIIIKILWLIGKSRGQVLNFQHFFYFKNFICASLFQRWFKGLNMSDILSGGQFFCLDNGEG
jgi:hypothetical protein